jgi:hypothetical protein
MGNRYPNILGIIVEVTEGFTVTVSLQTSPGLDGASIMADQPADTIEEARGVISRIARECWVPDDDVEIDIRMDTLPPRGPAN